MPYWGHNQKSVALSLRKTPHLQYPVLAERGQHEDLAEITDRVDTGR